MSPEQSETPANGDGAGPADSPSDVAAPGFDAITRACQSVHADREPQHYGTVVKFSVGGPDPLDGISAYPVDEPTPHWHLVTYGFSELYEPDDVDEKPEFGPRDADEAEHSGYGFELTMRLTRPAEQKDPPLWVLDFLQNLARYVFKTGNAFDAGHYLDLHGPIGLDESSEIGAVLFADDASLAPIDSPNGRVRFLQVVGITVDELRAIQDWDAAGMIELLRDEGELLLTDLDRTSLTKSDARRAEIEERTAAEGSSTGVLFVDVVGWERDAPGGGPAGVTLTLGALGVRDFVRLLRGRTLHGRRFQLAGPSSGVIVLAAKSPAFRVDDCDGLVLEIDERTANAMLETLVPRRGTYEWSRLPGLTLVVEPSEIKDRDGRVVDTIG